MASEVPPRLMPAVLAAVAAGAVLARLWTPALAGFLRDRGLVQANFLGEPVPCPLGLAPLTAALPLYALLSLAVPDARQVLLGLQAAVLFTALGGFLDDLAGAGEPKGLRGHLRALRRGRLTAGLLKACACLLAGLSAAPALNGPPGPGGAAEWFVDAVLIALCANTFNALDLRPGRAAKAFAAMALALPALPGGGAPYQLLLLAPMAGAVAGYLPFDLGRRGMLGDTGANPLGTVIGVALAHRLEPVAGAAAVALLLAFHLLLERVSLSRVIDANPLLRQVDLWGRREP